jgi:hypothetical protein
MNAERGDFMFKAKDTTMVMDIFKKIRLDIYRKNLISATL